jgi:hypothetical protein
MCSRSIVVGVAVLAFSASSALAAHRHHHVMNVAAPPAMPAPAMWTGGFNSSDHATYLKNLRDSGYNPRSDYVNGLMGTQ